MENTLSTQGQVVPPLSTVVNPQEVITKDTAKVFIIRSVSFIVTVGVFTAILTFLSLYFFMPKSTVNNVLPKGNGSEVSSSKIASSSKTLASSNQATASSFSKTSVSELIKTKNKLLAMKTLQTALEKYADDKGEYPADLKVLVPTYLVSLPISLTSPIPEDKLMYTAYQMKEPADTQNVEKDYTFGYHLGVAIKGDYINIFDQDNDCSLVKSTALASSSTEVSRKGAECLAGPEYFTESKPTKYIPFVYLHSPVWSVVDTDFQGYGSGEITKNCEASMSCIYDIVGFY